MCDLPALSCNLPGCSGSFTCPREITHPHPVLRIMYIMLNLQFGRPPIDLTLSLPRNPNHIPRMLLRVLIPSTGTLAATRPVPGTDRSHLYCAFPTLCRPLAAGNHRSPCSSPRWHPFAENKEGIQASAIPGGVQATDEEDRR